MSTRSTTHFIYGDESKPLAIVYRHPDGYPEGAGVDIHRFLDECSKLEDSRFTDPSYLAAKYVVFLAEMFNHDWDYDKNGKFVEVKPESRLEFISVGVTMRDPEDIDYRYVIDCKPPNDAPRFGTGSFRPKVTCYEVSLWGGKNEKKEVEIPLPAKVKEEV